jgi:hypothetical protein
MLSAPREPMLGEVHSATTAGWRVGFAHPKVG